MARSEDKCGDWIKVSVLGSGGFGIVTLWENKINNKTVALKICRDGAENFMSQKHKERWTKEVDIMRRLAHPNVVEALALPEDLVKLESNLPILCMEYCKKGDLRKVLNLPENCSGLQEPEIRNLLRDVKSAIEFLHKNKIIHRDLKPENIVLQELPNEEVVYKLIDLGYAKELDQNSLCSSFVGTLQYLAPELFTPHNYTCSVDYWSFGLVCHEVITGFRPFLPNMAPVSWMTHVKQKSSEDICIYQNADGSIEFSQQLFPENHISQCLRYEFEKWLRMALDWDGNKRGRASDNSLLIFNSLEVILNKKIVTVFSVVSYEKLSYEVDNSTAISTLQLWVERDTKQPIIDQLLLLPNGEKLTDEKLAYHCWDPNCQVAMVYIFSVNGLELPSVSPKLPQLVVQMLEVPKLLQPYYYLRRAWANAVYFLYSQLSLYQTFLEAYALKM
ncbi:hypothetical protein AAG570_009102 [Ranatra chinensis]|uniref:IkappaB kinase n=1 Tax=Ranatra chinensis TaxID=642074 RepID=A0ABD0YTF7_9HEMI